MLGMHLSTLNKQLGSYFGAPNGRGVLVEEVEPESKAEKAGFLAGDVIVKIGEETVKDVDDIHDAFREYKSGENANVQILRKGGSKTLTVEVPKRSRIHRMYGHDLWPRDLDLDIDVDIPEFDIERDGRGHEGTLLERELDKMKYEFQKLGREIRTGVRKLTRRLADTIETVAS
jgi:C-terminal processing protease CtpA/Prc